MYFQSEDCDWLKEGAIFNDLPNNLECFVIFNQSEVIRQVLYKIVAEKNKIGAEKRKLIFKK